MSEYITKKHLNDSLNKQTDEIIGVLQSFIVNVNSEFQKINNRLDELDDKYNHLVNTIDTFISRIDKYETELAARDSQFEKLLAWARKVSEKTGIPLDNL
jgi:septal ring factor EnvC (AmiA/AmiB activator)